MRHTRNHRTKKRSTRRKQHKGGSKLVPLLSRFTSARPVQEPVNYTAANKKRMNELRKYYAELNRQENEELARKEQEDDQKAAYEAELERTSPLQALAQANATELVNIQQKFKKGKFIPISNQQQLENQLAYLENLERAASRMSNRSIASNPRSVISNSGSVY